MTRCPVPVPCFCCLFVSEIYFWKYSRNWTKFYEEFLHDGRHQDTKGEPGGPHIGQGRPPATAKGPPTGGTRPCPVGTPSAPSDVFKLPHDLKTLGRPLFSTKPVPKPSSSQTLIREGSKAVSGTLPEVRSTPEGSSSPCLPPR